MKDINWDNRPRRVLDPRDPYLPFPGIYPTRWAIDMKWGMNWKNGFTHKWRYLGKPNSTVASFVRELLQTKRNCRIKGSEFIRNGVITQGFSSSPRTHLSADAWDQNKVRLVDPWVGRYHGWVITHWADHALRPLPVTYKGHRFVIYATATSAVSPSKLREYKQWLDNANIVFSKK